MEIFESLKNEYLLREAAATDKKLTWPQVFLTGLFDYLWILAVQGPVIRELHSVIKLPAGVWFLFTIACIYYVNKVMRLVVLTWHMDIRPGNPALQPPPPPSSPLPQQPTHSDASTTSR